MLMAFQQEDGNNSSPIKINYFKQIFKKNKFLIFNY